MKIHLPPTLRSALGASLLLMPPSALHAEIIANTFSIVAADPSTSEVGVAVATRLPAVGMYVPFVDPEAGAVASQAIVNPEYGPAALALLRQRVPPAQVVERLTQADARRDDRQLSVISPDGTAASFTGQANSAACGHLTGPNFAVAGNLLASTATLAAMAETFQNTEGRLSDRMLAAMSAGEKAGGDKRGKQSAAIVVMRPKAYFNGTVLELRVDEHADPIAELRRVHHVYMASFLNLPGYRPLTLGDTGGDVQKLNTWLAKAGHGDAAALSAAKEKYTTATAEALAKYTGANQGLSPAQSWRLQQEVAR